jgi:hypothetical protein
MDKELKKLNHETNTNSLDFDSPTRSTYGADRLDLCMINAHTFRLSLKQKDNVIGSISLHEVELAICEKLRQ